MADSRIKLSISSIFDGQGFSQAAGSIKTLGQNVQGASRVVSALGGTFAAVGGAAGNAAGAIGSFAASLASGPFGAAIAGISLIISLLSKWKNSMDENIAKHREYIEKMREGYNKRLAKSIENAERLASKHLDAVIEKGNTALSRIRDMTGAYDSLAQSERQASDALDRIAEAKLDANTQKKLSAASTDEEKAVINAQAAEEKAKFNATKNLKKADDDIYDARHAVDGMKKELNQLTKVAADMKKAGKNTDKIWDEYNKKTVELSSLENKLKAAISNRTAVQIENATAIAKASDEVKKAQKADQVAKFKKQQEDEISYNASYTSIEDQWREQQQTPEKKTQEDEKKVIEDKKKALEKQKQQADTVFNEQIKALKKKVEADQKLLRKGMAADAQHKNGLFGQYQYNLDENGNPKTFRDWQRANRYADRDDRDNNRVDPADRRAKKLERSLRRGRHISENDAKFLKQYREYQESLKAPIKIKDLTEKMERTLTNIKNQLNNLGAK